MKTILVHQLKLFYVSCWVIPNFCSAIRFLIHEILGLSQVRTNAASGSEDQPSQPCVVLSSPRSASERYLYYPLRWTRWKWFKKRHLSTYFKCVNTFSLRDADIWMTKCATRLVLMIHNINSDPTQNWNNSERQKSKKCI